MKIVINHLTRMQPGFFCAAGLECKTQLHIRPVLHTQLPVELLARCGGPPRRDFVVFLAISVSLCSEALGAAARPNTILLMGDDHGWEETGYNGHPHVKTPVKLAGGKATRDYTNYRHPPIAEDDYLGPRAIIDGRFKLVIHEQKDGDAKHELFGLQADPADQSNLIGEQPEIAEQLQNHLRRWQQSVLHSLTGAEYSD